MDQHCAALRGVHGPGHDLWCIPVRCVSTSSGQSSPPIAQRYARVVAAGALVGIMLSIGAMAVLAKAMSGADSYGELNSNTFEMIISETAVGIAWSVRLLALAACVGLAMSKLRIVHRLIGSAALSALALATMAWSGHGAMSEGAQGYVKRPGFRGGQLV